MFAAKPFQLPMLLSPHGAFPIICHNDVHDLIAKLLSEVCYDVQTEPYLQPLTGEIPCYRTAVHEDDVRVDIRAAGFWGCRHHRFFFDVRVFNAFAESNQSTSLATTFHKHEGEKRGACVGSGKRQFYSSCVLLLRRNGEGCYIDVSSSRQPFK